MFVTCGCAKLCCVVCFVGLSEVCVIRFVWLIGWASACFLMLWGLCLFGGLFLGVVSSSWVFMLVFFVLWRCCVVVVGRWCEGCMCASVPVGHDVIFVQF